MQIFARISIDPTQIIFWIVFHRLIFYFHPSLYFKHIFAVLLSLNWNQTWRNRHDVCVCINISNCSSFSNVLDTQSPLLCRILQHSWWITLLSWSIIYAAVQLGSMWYDGTRLSAYRSERQRSAQVLVSIIDRILVLLICPLCMRNLFWIYCSVIKMWNMVTWEEIM